MLKAEGLSRRFGDRVAVDAVSFQLARGELVGLLGENGAGKTTTLRMLAGFLGPSAGRIEIAGIDLAKQPLRARAQLGYLPEQVPLYDELRVDEQLAFRARLKGVAPGEIALAVTRAGLVGLERRLCGQLSRGQRQRVGIADAILGGPPVVLLDEPTTGLDPNQLRESRTLLRELAKERAVLVSTHALAEAEAMCDRVIVMHAGKIVANDAPKTLAAAHGGTLEAAFAALTGHRERAP